MNDQTSPGSEGLQCSFCGRLLPASMVAPAATACICLNCAQFVVGILSTGELVKLDRAHVGEPLFSMRSESDGGMGVAVVREEEPADPAQQRAQSRIEMLEVSGELRWFGKTTADLDTFLSIDVPEGVDPLRRLMEDRNRESDGERDFRDHR